jgi:hypothetical protein
VTSGWVMAQMEPSLDRAEPGAALGSKVMHAGWVYKRGDWTNPAFKKRWFVLRGGQRPTLSYYKTREDSDAHQPPRGHVLVDGMEVASDTGSDDGPEGKVECFAISAASGPDNGGTARRILCACDSKEERAAWTRALLTAAASCDNPDEATTVPRLIKQPSFIDPGLREAWASSAWSIPSSDSVSDGVHDGPDAHCGFSDKSKAWLYPGDRARRPPE